MPSKKQAPSSDNGNILYVGIDLGTSRSAVAASNDKRDWVHSYVGWPRDFVARRLLKRDVLFGQDAIDNRLSLDLVRPLEYGVIRNGTHREEEAVRKLIHHLISLMEPEDGQKIYAAVGVPAEALKVNKIAIREAVREFADTLMVVSEPFAVAYQLGVLNDALIVDIGAGTVDFCVMHGTMPGEEDQRSLRTAGDQIDQRLAELFAEKYPDARFGETLVRQVKEKHGRVGKSNSRIKVSVPVAGRFLQHDVTNEVRQACESVVPAIAETLIDLVARYEPEFQERVRKNIFLAGGGSKIRGMAGAVAGQLGEYGDFTIKAVDDPLFIGAEGALALAQDMPEQYWEDM